MGRLKVFDVGAGYSIIIVLPINRVVCGTGSRTTIGSFTIDGNGIHQNHNVEASASCDSRMSKQRCVKLLESYRAEREKVAKGRKFERCLREEVVNEALEKAIELLKNG